MNPEGIGGFKKGQSGNPGGRPKAEHQIQELARSRAPVALATLAHIARRGKSESARVAAATALLDRGYGRAPQSVSVNDSRIPNGDKPLWEYTDAELRAAIYASEAELVSSYANLPEPELRAALAQTLARAEVLITDGETRRPSPAINVTSKPHGAH